MLKQKKYIQKNFIKALKKQEGYLTVEITFVFSVLFFSLLLILFMGIILYQQVNLQSLAVRTSARGSVVYASRVKDMRTGVKTLEDFEQRDPYRYIPLFDKGTQQEYISILNTYVAEQIGKRNLLTGQSKEEGNYATIEDYIIIRRVKVNIKKQYHMPLDAISQMFGVESAFDIDTTAMSTVVDTPEFIRNIDLSVDILKQTEAFGKTEEVVQEIHQGMEKMIDYLNDTQ